MATAGRKSKLTKQLIEKIEKYISVGNTVKNTCVLCNISETAFYNWVNKMQKVEQKIENGQKINKNEKIFLVLIESIKIARANFENTHLTNINTQSRKYWAASAWLLERLIPDRYARKDRIDHNINVEFDLSKASIEEHKRIFEEIDIITDGKLLEEENE